ncbi:MAG: NINE protein [Planctomycetota bacterium]
MPNVYDYIDPRGRRSGPYTEEELRSLAARGLVEPAGELAIPGIDRTLPIADVRWLADAFPGSGPTPPPSPPPDAPEVLRTPAAPPTSPAAISPQPVPAVVPAPVGRATYVLLAILPAFFGVFGIHNVVAGYTAKGVLQLVLSLATLGGCVLGAIAPPCFCLTGPLWLGLFIWTICEAVTVTRDARGNAMV